MKRKISMCVLGMCIVLGGVFFWIFQTEIKEIQEISLQDVHISQLSNGKYKGVCETTLIQVEVEVTVQDCQIKTIDILKHVNGLGKEAEEIIDDMINHNSDQVDVISGATYSSLVIQKAVNEALVKGIYDDE